MGSTHAIAGCNVNDVDKGSHQSECWNGGHRWTGRFQPYEGLLWLALHQPYGQGRAWPEVSSQTELQRMRGAGLCLAAAWRIPATGLRPAVLPLQPA